MRTFFLIVIFGFKFYNSISQSFTSYFTGDTTDVATDCHFGVCLMGGATENDHAMRKFLEYANGGDVVVLRASGSNGYNNYLYSGLGITVNSVETILFHTSEASTDPYILRRIGEAEALWFAGGDQYDYVRFWKDTPVEDTINYLINEKRISIGGTSAGMAILGQAYFPAKEGTLYSNEALNDPYGSRVVVGFNDFLQIPFLENTITDTHYDREDPDGSKNRKGRHVVFLARLIEMYDIFPYGIASEEYTAVFINEQGVAKVFGSNNYDDFTWFIRPSSNETTQPEVLEEGKPLTWNQDHKAIEAIQIKGTSAGSNGIDLNDFTTIGDATFYHWYVHEGQLYEIAQTTNYKLIHHEEVHVSPNPCNDKLIIQTGALTDARIRITNLQGELLADKSLPHQLHSTSLDMNAFKDKVLLLTVTTNDFAKTYRILLDN